MTANVTLKDLGRLTFLDGQREASIGLGVDWPYPDLNADECVLPEEQKEFFKINDTLRITQETWNFWMAVFERYNIIAAQEGWEWMELMPVSKSIVKKVRIHYLCRVVGFYSETYGKTNSGGKDTIFLGYDGWL